MQLFARALGASTLASLCAFLALVLAWHHPLAPAVAFLACTGVAMLACLRPTLWPYLVLPALPLAGLAPWTGWGAVEEFDLLLLAVAAGGYTRLAWDQMHATAEPAPVLPSAAAWLLPVAAVTMLALWRGLQDAGGDSFGWWQGRGDPADSLRLAKGVAGACLLLPLLRAGWRDDVMAASTRLLRAFSAMLAVAGAGVLWERLAQGALLDGAASAPAGALFWGAEAGRAALPALLVVGMPCAVVAWAKARAARERVLPGLALALGAHACVVSFSPVAYLAVPVAVLLALWLASSANPRRLPVAVEAGLPRDFAALRARATAPAPHAGLQPAQATPAARARPASPPGLQPGLWLWFGFGVLALLLFPAGGWAGLGALLGAAVLILPLQALRSRLPARSLWQALLAGAAGGLGLSLAWAAFANGPVGAGSLLVDGLLAIYACTWAAAALALALAWLWGRRAAVLAALLGTAAALACLPVLAWGLGGAAAAGPALACGLVLLGVLAASTLRPRLSWPDSLGWQASLAACLGVAALLAGVLARAPWQDRLQQVAQHSQARQLHWLQILQAIDTVPEWLLGHGLGRSPQPGLAAGGWQGLALADARADMPVEFASPAGGDGGAEPAAAPSSTAATARAPQEGGFQGSGQVAVLAGSVPLPGQGLPWRLTQQLPAPEPGPLGVGTVQLLVRLPVASLPATLDPTPWRVVAEVCTGLAPPRWGCASATQRLAPASAGLWQVLSLPLPGPVPEAGPWYAPRPTVFSLALDAPGQRLEIARASLRDASGRELLRNGDFGAGLAHWHLARDAAPAPSANVPLQVLAEKGLLGLLAWALAAGWALWRLVLGNAYTRRLAPPLAAAGVGLLVVAAVYGLFDVPRAAFLVALWLVMALALPGRPPQEHERRQRRLRQHGRGRSGSHEPRRPAWPERRPTGRLREPPAEAPKGATVARA